MCEGDIGRGKKMKNSELYSDINGIKLEVPALLAGVLPVSPCRDKFHYEPFAFLGGW